jgi:hypothetical protein
VLLLTDPDIGAAAGRAIEPLVEPPFPEDVQVGFWAARSEGAAIREWLERGEVGRREVLEAQGFLLDRLDWFGTEQAVEVAAGLLGTGVDPRLDAIQELANTLQDMASKPDEHVQYVEAGDRDMYTVQETISHEETREEGADLLRRLGI